MRIIQGFFTGKRATVEHWVDRFTSLNKTLLEKRKIVLKVENSVQKKAIYSSDKKGELRKVIENGIYNIFFSFKHEEILCFVLLRYYEFWGW